MNIFQTDLKVLGIDNSGQIVNNYTVIHKTVTRMLDYEGEIAKHYKGLIKKFMNEESDKDSVDKEAISGQICLAEKD